MRISDWSSDVCSSDLGMVLMVAAAGWLAGSQVPPAPPVVEDHRCDWNIVRASLRLVRDAMRVRRLDLAILCISLFWAVGHILSSHSPPLVQNTFKAKQPVAMRLRRRCMELGKCGSVRVDIVC